MVAHNILYRDKISRCRRKVVQGEGKEVLKVEGKARSMYALQK